MKNVFLIASDPESAVNNALKNAFVSTGFDVRTMSPEKVASRKFDSGRELQAACVLVDCDSENIPETSTGLLGELSRISQAFAKKTPLFAYGSNGREISEACSEKDFHSILITPDNAAQTASLIQTFIAH
ncbi:MAG: hypothetical protein KDI11_07320 [Alphaproteobacteria bacterium]|nr:hypothetical protein [Alphaproteobacteria bacterium]